MSNHKRFLLLGSVLLVAGLLFAFSPVRPGTAYAANAAVSYANSHWNWTYYNHTSHPSCTSGDSSGCSNAVNVPAQGYFQPDFQCAEFVARALATEGYIPGLSSTSSQGAYGSYKPGNGKTYDLLSITTNLAGPGIGSVADFLTTYGYFKNVGHTVGDAEPGDLVVFTSGSTAEHVALITSSDYSIATIRIDAHNTARYDIPLSNEIAGFSGWYILHIQTGA
jgi:hypothetical protein